MKKATLLSVFLIIISAGFAQGADIFRLSNRKPVRAVHLTASWLPAVSMDIDHESRRIETQPSVFEDFNAQIDRGTGWAFAFNTEHDDELQTGIMFMGSSHDESATGEQLDTLGVFLEAGLLEYQSMNDNLRIRYSGLIGLGGMSFDFSDAYSDELEWGAEFRLSMGLEFKHVWFAIGGGGMYAGELNGQDHAEAMFVNVEWGFSF